MHQRGARIDERLLRKRIDAIGLGLDQLDKACCVVGTRLMRTALGRLFNEEFECVELDIVRAESAARGEGIM